MKSFWGDYNSPPLWRGGTPNGCDGVVWVHPERRSGVFSNFVTKPSHSKNPVLKYGMTVSRVRSSLATKQLIPLLHGGVAPRSGDGVVSDNAEMPALRADEVVLRWDCFACARNDPWHGVCISQTQTQFGL